MTSTPIIPAERAHTDDSLQKERVEADKVIAAKVALIAKEADDEIRRAREEADALIAAAREKADEVVPPRPTIAEERAAQDEAVQAHREAADENIQEDRDAGMTVLSRLFPMERDQTDRYLLTERKRSDEAVAHRDDFLGIVSHDLRNLLGGIVLSAGRLARHDPDNEETRRIQRYAARMNRLIGDLVDVASIDAGRLSIDRKPGDATALIAEAVDMFRASATVKGLDLETPPVERPVLADFDHDRLLQVLVNLITNSIKFSTPGSKIWVRGERAGEELHVSVSDTGTGIPAGMLESVFERFWQAGPHDKRGVGLGLYISRCIVEAHGGKIWAESKVGEGSKFFFTIPPLRPR